MHAYTHTHTDEQARTHAFTLTHVHTHTDTHACEYTHTYTHSFTSHTHMVFLNSLEIINFVRNKPFKHIPGLAGDQEPSF